MLGSRGDSFQELLRKLAKHISYAPKENTHIAKASRKRWRKGRQNRTQIIGVLATAQLDSQLTCLGHLSLVPDFLHMSIRHFQTAIGSIDKVVQ